MLTFGHFLVDVFSGMMPAVLPEIRSSFSMSLTRGVVLLSVLSFAANGVQILTGHMRAEQTRPLFLPLGILGSAVLCLMALVPMDFLPDLWLYVIALVGGVGIGIAHPEGLRGIYTLDKISGALATSIFMMCGFFGYAVGGWIASILVSSLGLGGLMFLIPAAALAAGAIMLFRVRLAVDKPPKNGGEVVDQISFWTVFAMALPVTLASTVIVGLLPSRLNELKFPLEFGGFSTLLLIGGGVIGSLFWGWVAGRLGEHRCIVLALLMGIPFLVLHGWFMQHEWAAWLLVVGGFGVIPPYPLMVNMARHSRGLKLGSRMAMIVGGAWGLSGVFFIGIGALADKVVGLQNVLNWAWVGYLVAAMVAVWLIYKSSKITSKSAS